MKIALHKSVDYGYEIIGDPEHYLDDDKFIRISEVFEYEPVLLPDIEINQQEIVAVDKAINKFMAETELKLGELKQRKAELLAICDHTAGEGK